MHTVLASFDLMNVNSLLEREILLAIAQWLTVV